MIFPRREKNAFDALTKSKKGSGDAISCKLSTAGFFVYLPSTMRCLISGSAVTPNGLNSPSPKL